MTMTKIYFYQIPQESSLGWVGYNASVKTKRINLNNYVEVYSKKLWDDSRSDEEILKDIYDKYSVTTPSNIKMFPVAVSDIVCIEKHDSIHYYFRDRCQWILVDDFIK